MLRSPITQPRKLDKQLRHLQRNESPHPFCALSRTATTISITSNILITSWESAQEEQYFAVASAIDDENQTSIKKNREVSGSQETACIYQLRSAEERTGLSENKGGQKEYKTFKNKYNMNRPNVCSYTSIRWASLKKKKNLKEIW